MSWPCTNSAFACGDVVVTGIFPSALRPDELDASAAGAGASFLAQPETARTMGMRSEQKQGIEACASCPPPKPEPCGPAHG